MIEMEEHHFDALARIAEKNAGLHMPVTKRAFVTSRLQRRLRLTQIPDFDRYLQLLQNSGPDGSSERRAFVSSLTTNVTGIFREAHHFVLLASHLNKYLTGYSRRKYQIWSAGCASGEEALSIAATCRSIIGPDWARQVRILATDVDEDILARARNPGDILALSKELCALPTDLSDGIRLHAGNAEKLISNLQAGIDYQHHNLLDPPPGTDVFDVIFCRNVTIYFSRSAQEKVHCTLREHLVVGGLLAIGHSERLLGAEPAMIPAGRTAFMRAGASPEAELTAEGGRRWP